MTESANDIRKSIEEATARRIARTQELLDQSAIRSNAIPKKSRRTSVFHRALR